MKKDIITKELEYEMQNLKDRLQLEDTGENPEWVHYFELKAEIKGRTDILNEKKVEIIPGKMKKLVIYLDVDGMLCPDFHERYRETWDKFRDEYIRFINWVYDQGHEIVIYTSRGKMQKDKKALNNLIEMLKVQGLKYTRIDKTKPDFDFILDDKAVPSLDLFKKMFEKFTGVMFYG